MFPKNTIRMRGMRNHLLVVTIILVLVKESLCVVHEGEIVVKVLGGLKQAKTLIEDNGYSFKGPVQGFHDIYVMVPLRADHLIDQQMQKRGVPGRSSRLIDDDRVLWADSQSIKSRQKRDFIPFPELAISPQTEFNDELWDQEWYLHDTRTRPDLPKLDLNVLPLYRYGITGNGVRITILDDGIEYTHDDLTRNYDPSISYDCNEEDNDPMPCYDPDTQNSHGTRCAGEIAMTANNFKCGVGIAFNARIGGVKLLDGLVNDRVEGTALSFGRDLVDIYSASWGPNDDGKTVDGPGRLAQEALERGVREGRRGRGSIYVWASGNGGSLGDNCNCDGYLTSIYTISIGSASQRGEFPWYGEACASTLAVTYSSGAYQDQMIATTDLRNECTIKHTGTSASAPLAAGIIGLALEINPDLTWRDVQHIMVWTSEYTPVADNPGWVRNAAGLWTNTRFGFGLMNALTFVAAAANWTQVPEKYTCHTHLQPLYAQRRYWNPITCINTYSGNTSFSYGEPIIIPLPTTGCDGTPNEVTYLEHVQVQLDITYTIRGALEIHLTSPHGTKVQILAMRKLDLSTDGFHQWKFMSVMTWGEQAAGIWLLHIADNMGAIGNFGHVGNITLILHGTRSLPEHMANGVRLYNDQYNKLRDGQSMVKEFYGHFYYQDDFKDKFVD